MSAAPGTPNRTDADSTSSRTVKRSPVYHKDSDTGFPDPACSLNRGEAATTLENYGRAAGADLINSGRGAATKKNNYKILDMFKSAQERGKT